MKSVREEGLVKRGYRITGRVQGVYFRAWTQGIANELGLRGTVRNRTDGSVEARVLGSPGAVSFFEYRLREGPTGSAVDRVEPLESAEPLPSGPFQILPTA